MQSNEALDLVTLWNSIFLGIGVLGTSIFVCEAGQRLTDKFDEISYKFKQLNWYLYPIAIQQMLPTILIGVQKPIFIECYGIFDCSREQFKKVHAEF